MVTKNKALFSMMLVVLSGLGNAQKNPYCTESFIKQAQTTCNVAYGGTIGSDLTPICNRLDCVLQCLKDAVQDCWKTEQFFNYDLKTTVVRYRAMCNDLAKTKRAQIACNITMCEQKYLTPTYRIDMQSLYIKKDFAGYKKLECNRAKDTLNCISDTPVDKACTAELEDLSKGIETVRFSMSECGIAQDHQFFSTYADRGTPCANPAVKNKCLITPLTKRVSQCLWMPNVAEQSSEFISSMCSNLECNLKCYHDAIGDCYKEVQHFNKDPHVTSVQLRALCDSTKGGRSASPLSLCTIRNKTCSDSYITALSEANKSLMGGAYIEYRNLFCKAMNDLKACADVTVTEKCTESIAKQARSMYQVVGSYAACGPQDHEYFTIYGGDVNCITSATVRVMSSCVTSRLLIFSFIVLLQL